MSDILEELVTKFTYDVDQAGLNKYLRGQEKINRNTKKMIGLNTTLGKMMRRLFVGVGISMGIGSLVNTYRSLDLIRRSIEGLTQSTQDWEYIQKEAFRTATNIETVAAGYRNFYSAATMAGMDKESVQTMYSGILEAGRAVGATQPQIKGALLALEQMFSKGKVSMEELRRQLGNALPGAFEVAAKAMGVTTEEFNKLIKKGVQATDLVPKFTEEYRKTFEKSFPEAMKSLDAAIINLDNSWKIFQYDIMNSGAGKELAKFIVEISKFLQSSEAKSMAQAIGVALQGVAKAIGFIVKHIKTILFLWGVSSLIQGIISLSALTPVLKSIGSAAVMVGKNFLWVTAIAAALYGIYLVLEDIFTYINHPEWDSFTRDLVNDIPQIGDWINWIEETFREFQPLFGDFAQIWRDFGKELLSVLKEARPLVEWYFKTSILNGLIMLSVFTAILKIINFIIEGVKKLGSGLKQIGSFQQNHPFLSSFAGTPFGGWAVGGGLLMDKLKGLKAQQSSATMPIPITGSNPSLLGGATLTKTANNTKSITNHITINAQDRSDTEMVAIINKTLNGGLDSVNKIMNPAGFDIWGRNTTEGYQL